MLYARGATAAEADTRRVSSAAGETLIWYLGCGNYSSTVWFRWDERRGWIVTLISR